jgi:hypothetical protein
MNSLLFTAEFYEKNAEYLDCSINKNEVTKKNEITFYKIRIIQENNNEFVEYEEDNITLEIEGDKLYYLKQKPPSYMTNIKNIVQFNNVYFNNGKLYNIEYDDTWAYMNIFDSEYTNNMLIDFKFKKGDGFVLLEHLYQFKIYNVKLEENKNKLGELNNKIKELNKTDTNDETTMKFLNDECPVCMTQFCKMIDKIVTLCCGHIVCKDCIDNWSESKCPVCMQEFIKSSISNNKLIEESAKKEKCVTVYNDLIKYNEEIKKLTVENEYIAIIIKKRTANTDYTLDKIMKMIHDEYEYNIGFTCSFDYNDVFKIVCFTLLGSFITWITTLIYFKSHIISDA